MGVLCARQIVETPGHLMLSNRRNSISLMSQTRTFVRRKSQSSAVSHVKWGPGALAPEGFEPLTCVADVYQSCQPLMYIL